jgi:hypothetical protein
MPPKSFSTGMADMALLVRFFRMSLELKNTRLAAHVQAGKG